MGRVFRTTENTRRHDTINNRGQSGLDKEPGRLASGSLEFLGRSDAPDVGVPGDAGYAENKHGNTDDGNQHSVQGRVKKNDEATRQNELHLRIYLEPAVLTICTVPYNMMADQNAREMNERVRNINEIKRQIQQRSVLPMRVLDVARMMEDSLPENSSSSGNHFDRPRGTEWLNSVFQRHINFLQSDLVETGQFTFDPAPIPPFFSARLVSDRLGKRIDSRGSSTSSRSRQLRLTPMKGDKAESSTPQSSVVSSVVMVDNKKKVEGPGEASRTRYLQRVKNLDLEDLSCRQELTEVVGPRVCHIKN